MQYILKRLAVTIHYILILLYREDSSDIKEDLPLRLRIFQKFPQRPLMAKEQAANQSNQPILIIKQTYIILEYLYFALKISW